MSEEKGMTEKQVNRHIENLLTLYRQLWPYSQRAHKNVIIHLKPVDAIKVDFTKIPHGVIIWVKDEICSLNYNNV